MHTTKERKREFYELRAEDAYEILLAIAKINGMEDNVMLVEPTAKDRSEEEKAEEGRTKTNLPRMDWLIKQNVISRGDKVYIINRPEDIAEIKDSENVIYNGEIMTFNQFGCKITGWKSIQIYAYMKKVGCEKTISELRKEKMAELGMIK